MKYNPTNTVTTLVVLVITMTMHFCKTEDKNNYVKINGNQAIHRENCIVEEFCSPEEASSMLIDMVTYIGRKPPLATSMTRFHEEFREYYVRYATEFRLVYFVSLPDGGNYYYLTRPARSTKGNRRGVGGWFTKESGQINDFLELFNTPVMTEEELEQIGWDLFKSMVEQGHVDQFLKNNQYIEWPDDRLKYDRQLFEWRYVGVD